MKHRCISLLAAIGVLFASASPAWAKVDAGLQMLLGNPSNATADTNNHENYLIQRAVQALAYNDSLGQPNWASWNLTADDLGDSGRSPSFYADTNLPPNFRRVGTGEYSGSGYDRGHLCPSADRTANVDDNNAVFLMSNIMPQAPEQNSGVWGTFEGYCRSLVQSPSNYELFILCGPSGFTGESINGEGEVAIPRFTWKIVVVVPPGTNSALERITATNRVIAIKVPNTNGVSTSWQDFVTSANQIRADTGFNFFTALPNDVAEALRNKVDGQTNPPPALLTHFPNDGQIGTTVLLTGTNFGGATAVAFNGTGSSFTLVSECQILAVVPTNAGTGFISVTTPSGTAISPAVFEVMDRGGKVYSGVLAGWDMSGLPGGLNNFGPSPMVPTTNAPALVSSGLIRGDGLKVSGTAAAGGWGGTGFTNHTVEAAIASGRYVSFNLTATNGYTVSYSAISRLNYRRSSTSPTNGILQYQVGTGGFFDITNLFYGSSSSGGTTPKIDLSGIEALQNVGATTNVTFRLVNFGGTSAAGTWYVYDYGSSSELDLEVVGTVTELLSTTNVTALAPKLSVTAFGENQILINVSGAPGTNYVLQTTSQITPPAWLSLVTNASPFAAIETNTATLDQRFFRARTLSP